VLFEIATDPPGFTVDEPYEKLGRDLKVPVQYEFMRTDIESRLPKLPSTGRGFHLATEPRRTRSG